MPPPPTGYFSDVSFNTIPQSTWVGAGFGIHQNDIKLTKFYHFHSGQVLWQTMKTQMKLSNHNAT